jgi:hypothetical protein
VSDLEISGFADDTNSDIFDMEPVTATSTVKSVFVDVFPSIDTDDVQFVKIFNNGPSKCYVSPKNTVSPTTGEELSKKQWITYAIRSKDVFFVTQGANTADLIITILG